MIVRKTKKKTKYKINGIQNLSYVILAMSMVSFTLESIRENGIRTSFLYWCVPKVEVFYLIATVFISMLKMFIPYMFFRKNKVFVFVILASFEIVIAYINFFCIFHVYFSVFSLSISIYFLAKAISFYVSCNGSYYINKSNFLYFIAIPTLCYYDFGYEKKKKIRYSYRKFIFLIIRFVLVYLILFFMIDQLLILSREKIYYNSTGWLEYTENFLKFSIFSTLTFLILFYFFFCCFLEIISMLTKFRSYEFYRPWWNSSTLKEFWISWNLMVHFWFKRHVFYPMIRAGYSKKSSAFVCFFISGIVHEYVISLASKELKLWIFFGFILQPLIIGTSDRLFYNFPKLGNIVFWILFCIIGQPICIILY